MRTKSGVPVATFKALIEEVLPSRAIRTQLRSCGVRRRCPPVVSPAELIGGLIFHAVAGAGTLAQHVKPFAGKSITDGALSQRRALLPGALFANILAAALKPKADPARHPDAFY